MEFRNRETGRIRVGEPGTARYAIFSRSERYEPVEMEEPDTSGHLESLKIPHLREIAAQIGVTLPDKARKAEIIDAIREG